MTLRYDKEKLKRTLDFLKWGFHNGTVSIELDEEGNLHFFVSEVKIITIKNEKYVNLNIFLYNVIFFVFFVKIISIILKKMDLSRFEPEFSSMPRS